MYLWKTCRVPLMPAQILQEELVDQLQPDRPLLQLLAPVAPTLLLALVASPAQ
jgi:hypothetical protein